MQQYDTERFSASERVPARPNPQRNRLLAFVLIGLGLMMLLNNTGRSPFSLGKTTTHGIEVPTGEGKSAVVRVDWGSGSLLIGGSNDEYVVAGSVEARREPSVDVVERSERGTSRTEVTIRDRAGSWFLGGGSGAAGSLLLNEALVYELDIDTGSGSTELDLSQHNVSDLTLDSGSGSVDLRLPEQGALSGELDTGSGALSLTLPPEVAARIEIDDGSGYFDAGDRLKLVDGEEGDDAVYETPGYASAKERIDLRIDSGSGSVSVR